MENGSIYKRDLCKGGENDIVEEFIDKVLYRYWEDIKRAVEILKSAGCKDIFCLAL